MPLSDYLNESPSISDTYPGIEEPDKKKKTNISSISPINPVTIPPGSYEQQLAQLSGQMPDRNSYVPSVGHRILNALAGFALGGRGHRLEAIENLNNLGYDRAVADWQEKIKALDPLVKSEQERTKSGLEVSKLGEKTEKDIAQEERLTEAQQQRSAYQDQVIKSKNDQIDLMNKYHEGQLSLKDFQLKLEDSHKTIEEFQKKINEIDKLSEGEKNRNAAQKRVETLVTGRANLTDDEKNNVKKIGDQIQATDNPDLKQNLFDRLSKKEQSAFSDINPDVKPWKKMTAQERQSVDSSLKSLDNINNLRSLVSKLKDQIGPLKGRVNNIKEIVGTNKYEVARLINNITTLLLNEGTTFGARGITTPIIETLRKGGIANISNSLDQFLGGLKGTEDQALRSYKATTGEDYKPPKEDKYDPLKGIKVKVVK